MSDNIFDLSLVAEIFNWEVLVYILLSGGILATFKFINGLTSGYQLNFELTDRDNKAVAISLAGFLFSLCLIIHGVLIAPGEWTAQDNGGSSWLGDLKDSILWSSLGCLLLLMARIINDKFILSRFSNRKELAEDHNVGVGLVQAGSYIATALVIRANLIAPDILSLGEELLLTLIWFTACQLLLILFALLYQIVTKYDLHEELRDDNPAAGAAFAGNIVAFGILLAFYISVYDSLLGLPIWAAVAVILLFIVRSIVDKILLPNQKLDREIARDRNWGAGTIEAVTAIGSALIISGSFS